MRLVFLSVFDFMKSLVFVFRIKWLFNVVFVSIYRFFYEVGMLLVEFVVDYGFVL